jgi:dihydrofolate synthase/folylpolyglutamate synthase
MPVAKNSITAKDLGLDQWLAYMERIHGQAISMGLDRTEQVRAAMQLAPSFPVITVAGTNGKGSACAILEAILHAAGYRVGTYTSPHLLRYNERVRVAKREVPDAALCSAFELVERARGDIPLTYFEFGTLGAVQIFASNQVDVAILEVGLGGRLDAVNVFEPTCSLIMCIDLDHQDYLGTTREAIGREKAGILRAGKPAVCADLDPPISVLEHARELGALFQVAGRDFQFVTDKLQWQWSGAGVKRSSLPYPALRGAYQVQNAAACLAVLEAVRERLPVDMGAIRRGLLEAEVPARFQVLPGQPQIILDVAHNPHAARGLRASLAAMPRAGNTLAVFSMLRDKDLVATARELKDCFDAWHVSGLEGPRGATARDVAEALRAAGVVVPVHEHADPAAACQAALGFAGRDDRIVVFGSFYTVGLALRDLSRQRGAKTT